MGSTRVARARVMTTIAFRDGIMAATTAAWTSIYQGSGPTIFRTRDGGLVAMCGDTNMARSFVRWIEANEDEAQIPRIPEKTDFGAIVVGRNGVVGRFTESFQRQDIDAEFHALGSGSLLALGAMAMGASAEKAVEIACQFDPWSRGPVQVERLYL